MFFVLCKLFYGTALVRKGLEALISLESSRRPASLVVEPRKKSECQGDEGRGVDIILAGTNVWIKQNWAFHNYGAERVAGFFSTSPISANS